MKTRRDSLTPPETKEPGLRPAVAGFETSRGSLYRLNADGKVQRLKKLEDSESYRLEIASQVLYVTRDGFDLISPIASSVERRRIGSYDERTGFFTPLYMTGGVPEGSIGVVAIFDKETGLFLRAAQAKDEPELGLYPVEKLYSQDEKGEDFAYDHAGTEIVRLYNAAEFDCVWADAMNLEENTDIKPSFGM